MVLNTAVDRGEPKSICHPGYLEIQANCPRPRLQSCIIGFSRCPYSRRYVSRCPVATRRYRKPRRSRNNPRFTLQRREPWPFAPARSPFVRIRPDGYECPRPTQIPIHTYAPPTGKSYTGTIGLPLQCMTQCLPLSVTSSRNAKSRPFNHPITIVASLSEQINSRIRSFLHSAFQKQGPSLYEE